MAQVKICGINDAPGFDAVVTAGADFVGFVFFPPSPRAVTPAQAAALSARAEKGPLRTGLFVDPTDDLLAETLATITLDIIQLHGEESPDRVAAIRARFGLPVMKAIGIATSDDLRQIDRYAPVADRLLLDAKIPHAVLPGGNAVTFDWSLLRGVAIPRPWLLAGGLTLANLAEAIRITGAPGLDLSSGVEKSRGVKDPALIAAFVTAARAA